MKPWSRWLLLGVCVTAMVTALFLVAPTYARYLNETSTAVVYGSVSAPIQGMDTMSPDTAVYDFGLWTLETDTAAFTHTVCITDTAPVEGTLHFSWDAVTRSQGDVAFYVDPEYYTEMQVEEDTVYTVSADDGILQIPFSLYFGVPTASRVAVLDVGWYPADSDVPTLFSRYLLTLDPSTDDPVVVTEPIPPVFIEEDTLFLTDRLLQVMVTTPADHSRVWLTPTEGLFPAYVRYFSDSYPHGVTLLRDSAIYIESNGDGTCLLVVLSEMVTDATPLSLTVGASDTLQSTLSCTPLADTALLTVALSDPTGVVSATRPLTVTLTETGAFRDPDWMVQGDIPTDLTWQIHRKVGDVFLPVAEEELTVAVEQTDTGGTLTVSSSEGIALPGTYLLTVTQTYYDYPVCETPIWFFVDYR